MNVIIIKGNLTDSPRFTAETKKSPARANFSVAVNHGYDDAADFFNCTAWRKQAEFINEYFDKGDPVLIRGSMTSYKTETEDGSEITRWSLNVDAVEFCAPAPKKSKK